MLWSTLELGHYTEIHNTISHIDSWIERLSLILYHRSSKSRTRIIYFFLSIVKVSFPRGAQVFNYLETLESFSLTRRYGIGVPDIPQLGYTPKLKALALSIQHGVAFNMLSFPWSQLLDILCKPRRVYRGWE